MRAFIHTGIARIIAVTIFRVRDGELLTFRFATLCSTTWVCVARMRLSISTGRHLYRRRHTVAFQKCEGTGKSKALPRNHKSLFKVSRVWLKLIGCSTSDCSCYGGSTLKRSDKWQAFWEEIAIDCIFTDPVTIRKKGVQCRWKNRLVMARSRRTSGAWPKFFTENHYTRLKRFYGKQPQKPVNRPYPSFPSMK